MFEWTRPDPAKENYYAESGDYAAWLTFYPEYLDWSVSETRVKYPAGWSVQVQRNMRDGTVISINVDFYDQRRSLTLDDAKERA